MQALNFPKYAFRLKSKENKTFIFDIIRKKYILLQPEEWVRQHTLHYLSKTKKYPLSLVSVEKQLIVNGLRKRYDLIIYNPDGSIKLLAECKAPTISISQEVFDQLARYNLSLKAEFLMVTNGLQHYFCKMDFKNEKYRFLEEIPDFSR